MGEDGKGIHDTTVNPKPYTTKPTSSSAHGCADIRSATTCARSGPGCQIYWMLVGRNVQVYLVV